jgi:tRNA(fMet)-specific endonuclease VapC
MYMLDTNICIYIIKRRPPEVLRKFESLDPDVLHISVVTQAELQYGVEKSSRPRKNQQALDEFLSRLMVLPWTSDAATQYGKIRKQLEKRGAVIGNMDLMIAAHALAEKDTVVTNNVGEFGRVEGLSCENWAP